MGYRSVFITEDTYSEIPEWFAEKYKTQLHMNTGKDGKTFFPVSSKGERKFYMVAQDELFLDIARILRGTDKYPRAITGVLLHEDGLVSRVNIHPEKIEVLHQDDYSAELGDNDSFEINADVAEV